MKKLTITAILLLSTIGLFCQSLDTKMFGDATSDKSDVVTYTGESISISLDKKETTISGLKSIKTNLFSVENAETAIIDHKNKKLIIYNFEKFSMKGSIVSEINKEGTRRIEYTIGEEIAYIY